MNRSWNFRRGVLLALAGYTAFLVFAAPQRCADALQAGLRLCGGPLLVSLFPFLIVSALAAGCGAGQWLGFVFRPAARLMGIRAKGAGGVLLIGALGGFAPAAVAASEAVRTGQLTSRQASALLPACVCSGPSFVILTVGQQMLGSRAVGVRLFAAQLLAGYLTAALLCRMQGGAGQAPPAQGETIPLPALDAVIAQAAVTYLKLCTFGQVQCDRRCCLYLYRCTGSYICTCRFFIYGNRYCCGCLSFYSHIHRSINRNAGKGSIYHQFYISL